jgi:hypothetical protein
MKINPFNKKLVTLFSILLILLTGAIGCSQHESQRPDSPSCNNLKSNQNQGPSAEEAIEQFDKNKDGKLSKEEFPGPDDHFSQFDTNKDGFIEKDEMPDGPPPKK